MGHSSSKPPRFNPLTHPDGPDEFGLVRHLKPMDPWFPGRGHMHIPGPPPDRHPRQGAAVGAAGAWSGHPGSSGGPRSHAASRAGSRSRAPSRSGSQRPTHEGSRGGNTYPSSRTPSRAGSRSSMHPSGSQASGRGESRGRSHHGSEHRSHHGSSQRPPSSHRSSRATGPPGTERGFNRRGGPPPAMLNNGRGPGSVRSQQTPLSRW